MYHFRHVWVIGVLLLGLAAGAWAQEQRTGLRPPTAEERQWEAANLIQTFKVHLNDLGLARANAARKLKGLPQLDRFFAVRRGDEVTGSSTGAPTVGASALPTGVDNSTLPAFPPIRNQGSLGSCAAFSTTYYTMTYMVAMARGWDERNNSDNTNKFSPKWTYNMVNNGVDGGAWITNAYNVMLKHGNATWADFPYVGSTSPVSNYRGWATTAPVWRNALNYRMDKTGTVSNVDTDTGLANVKALLADGYVLNFGTNIYCWHQGTIDNDPATTEDDPYVGKKIAYYVDTSRNDDGHAMTIVGYNDAIWIDINGNNQVDPGEKGALKIANSWGTTWGDAGFIWLSYDALKTTTAVPNGPNTGRRGAFWYNQVYWITARASYTPTMTAQFTVNTAARNQLKVTLGLSDLTRTTPATTWTGTAVNNQGGPYAFDGGTTATDATVVFDFTDLAPTDGSTKRWYVGISDNSAGNPCTLKDFTLVPGIGGSGPMATGLPVTADGSTQYGKVDYGVTMAHPQPDGQIRHLADAAYLGDNIYNTTGISQTASDTVPAGQQAAYAIKAQNDGDVAEALTVTGPAGGAGWTLRYFDATTAGAEITAQVTGSGWTTPSLTPGQASEIRVEVVPDVTVTGGTARDVLVKVASTSDATKADVVKASVTKDGPLSAVNVTASPLSPQLANTAITVTASAVGGTAEYQFRVGQLLNGSYQWSTVQVYGVGSTYTWRPSVAGTYALMVWARMPGSIKLYEVYRSIPYTINPLTLSSVSLTVTPPSPGMVGVPVNLSASATGGTAEYQFRLATLTNGVWVWSTLRPYSTVATYTWQPSMAGRYVLMVWARAVGSKQGYEVYQQAPYTVQ